MKRFAALLVPPLLGALLLGACGLPDHTEPRYVAPAVTPTPAQGRAQTPPGPVGASNSIDLVSRYLQTSVGGNVTSGDQPDAVSETQTRMKTFMTPSAQLKWKPDSPLNVVKTHIVPLGDGNIDVETQPVGVLDTNGQLGPAQSTLTVLHFRAEPSGALQLSQVPDGMWLSIEGLRQWYQQQPVYFWEKGDQPKLVPDLRYMPTTLLGSKRVGEVVAWLRQGPPAWLGAVVDPVPTEIETKDNPTFDSDHVTVNLSPKARNSNGLGRYATQLRWSIPNHPPVSLSVDGRDIGVPSDGYEDDNAAVLGSGENDPVKYGVFDGVARPAEIPVAGPPALFEAGGSNANVVSATINRTLTRAALVRPGKGGLQTLWVSAADGPAAPLANRYVETGVSGTRLSRPVWINRPVQGFLICDGNRLYMINPPQAAGAPVKWAAVNGADGQPVTGVTAFSVAPDGRRIALIRDNRVGLAALQFDGDTPSVASYKPAPVVTSLRENLAVGWLTETSLAVGGKPSLTATPAYALLTVTIDGLEETGLPAAKPDTTSTSEVTAVSVRTADPKSPATYVVFEANSAAEVLYAEGVNPLTAGPTPLPTTTPNGKVKVTAPFYAD